MELQTQQQILKKANEFFGMNLANKTREREYVHARQMLVALMREHYNIPYLRIALLLDRDHSTMIHNYKSHCDTMDLEGISAYTQYADRYYAFVKYMTVQVPTFSKWSDLELWARELVRKIKYAQVDDAEDMIVNKARLIAHS